MTRSILGALLVVAGLTLSACETGGQTASTQPTISLTPSNRNILAGEVVTVTTQTRNTLGRDSEIQWQSSGGDLTTSRDGRIARVQFNEPGQYKIRANLMVNGQPVQTREVTIQVRPLA